MTLTSVEERKVLRESIAEVFRKEVTPLRMRQWLQSERGRSETLWTRLAELGVTGLLVGEEYGGSGGCESDALVVLEEAGRRCVPDAILESVFVGAPLLAEGGTRTQRARWLPLLSAGSAVATVALDGARYVVDAHVADLILLEVEGEMHALTRDDFAARPVRSVDPSRRLFAVDASLSRHTLMPAGAATVQRAMDRALVGSAALLNGLAAQMLAVTIEYVQQRHQFGRPVGSFQAVKHMLADAHSRVVLSTAAARAAADELDSSSSEATVACQAAKICAVGAERRANDVALQCHGGIGFTWEYDLQMWLKRGKALEFVYGSERSLARQLGSAPAEGP